MRYHFFIVALLTALLGIAEGNSEEEKIGETIRLMRILGVACESYAVDNNKYPPARNISELKSILQPTYLRNFPSQDEWGRNFVYVTDSDNKNYWIISYGSDGLADKNVYDSNGFPTQSDYEPTRKATDDIIFSDGMFIRYPRNLNKTKTNERKLPLSPVERTMHDLRIIGTACEAFAVDHNLYPEGSTLGDLGPSLKPTYLENLPMVDAWGNAYLYLTDSERQQYWLISLGEDGLKEEGIYGDNGVPTMNEFKSCKKDRSCDIIFSSGIFLRNPEVNSDR